MSDGVDIPTLRYRGAVLFLVAYGVLLAVAGPSQWEDPFFHYDDAPALYALTDDYFHKAVSEGRWFNYLWHMREFRFSAAGNFQLYLVGWAAFIAAAAASIFRSGSLVFPSLFAALVALGPQTTQMAGWYNSLVPGVWLLGLFAILALFLSERTGRWLMFFLVPVALQAYTPYPFLLLAICLFREDRPRNLRSLITVTILFCVALVIGILAVQALNYAIAGVFDVEPHKWRSPTPAEDFAGLIANLPKVGRSLLQLCLEIGFRQPILASFLVFMFAVGFLRLLRLSPHDALAVSVVIGVGLGLLLTYVLLEGILLPFRATSFLWFVLALCLVLPARASYENGSRMFSMPTLVPLAVLLAILPFVFADFSRKTSWQGYVDTIVEHIPEDAENVYIYGPFATVARAPAIDSIFDLRFHIIYKTGIFTYDCEAEPDRCKVFGDPFAGQTPGEETAVKMMDGVALVLPARRDFRQ